ncbi:hypothetical protein [Stenotrophomonas maltophilia]|uniref:hypothetical protein n=1 Tax=Stenotrophomonas maltophilia TaxID=40324 RepID=UPI00066E0F25|nr:hypothetical protein [Stenotrophomonas maltophilia]
MDERLRDLEDTSPDIAAEIRKRGGLYDECAIEDVLDRHLFLNAIMHFGHMVRLTTERYYAGTGRRLQFGIVNSLKIMAFASSSKNDVDFIGVSVGALSFVSAVSTRMLSNPNVLTHIGSAGLEKHNCQALPMPGEQDPESFSPIRPNCPVRGAFAKHWALTGLDFIFAHEITHLTSGHLALQKKAKHADPAKARPKLSLLEVQAIELDADRGATEWMLEFTEFVRNSEEELCLDSNHALRQSWDAFYKEESATMMYCFMASYLALRMHRPRCWDPTHQFLTSQPEPPLRMGTLMGYYADALKQIYSISWEKAQEQVSAWCLVSEQAFADLVADSGRGEVDDGVISSFFERVGDYYEKVSTAYEFLAPELNELAMPEARARPEVEDLGCGTTSGTRPLPGVGDMGLA